MSQPHAEELTIPGPQQDFSHAEAENMLRTIYGTEEADRVMQHRWQVIK